MSAPGPRLWWLAGHDAADLATQLDRLGTADRGQQAVAPPPGAAGPARLGIVEPDERKLRLARRVLAEGRAWRGRSDIWFVPAGLAGRGGKVAFLFPGVEPTFGVEAMDLPALAERCGLTAPAIEDDTVAHRSASIYRIGIFLDRVARHLGVEPDLVAGHSIGEWSGSVAAGIVPAGHADDLLDVLDLSAVEFPDLDFAAVAAGVEVVGPVVDDLDDLVISHDNAPGQSIVCGIPARVDELLARLRDRKVLGYRLGFQSGFHTPSMEASLPEFRAHLERMEVGPARIPMWSATSVAPYPDDPDAIIALHLRHLVEPVRFRPLVERLYHDAGARVFVQVGVGSLTGFVADTLGGLDHASVALLAPRRPALSQAARALTGLWVEGLDLRPDALAPVTAPAPVTTAARAPGAGAPPVATPATASRTTPGDPTLLLAADMLVAGARAGRDVLDALTARLVPAAVAHPAPGHTSPLRAPTAGPGITAPRPDAGPAAPAAPAGTTPPASRSGIEGAEAVLPAWAPAPARPWPTGPVTLRRLLSLETMPETMDHTLYQAPDDWPDVSDRFPIVAMTTQLQLLEDIAAGYAGGRDVVELFGVRNYRWLDIADPLELEITVTPKGDDVLAIALGPYCRANVRVGRFPPRPRHEARPLARPRPTAHTAREMFDLRLMFHGPAFQGITALGPVGDDGLLGEFENLATPGSLLDNLGKLIAYWAIDHGGIGEAALPSGVARVQLFGPKPPVGVPVHCDIRVAELQRDLIRADGVLVLDDGTVLARVEGWTSILFHLDELMEPLHHGPDRHDVTEPQPGGWYVVRERWPTGPARDLTARRYLNRHERARYERLNLLEQRRSLLEAVTAKDAVRRWLRDVHGVACYPFEVTLVPDGDRRFRVDCRRVPTGHDPRVTVSTVNWVAVAVVGDGAHRDIEAADVGEAGGPAEAATRAADAVAARNPGARVRSVERPTHSVPSRLEVPDPPPFAVAWT